MASVYLRGRTSIATKQEQQEQIHQHQQQAPKNIDVLSPTETAALLPFASEGKKLCGNCGKEFSSKQSLSRHKRNCGRSTLTPCEKCHKQFARIDSLKRHIVSCERRRSKPSTCNMCNKVFRNNWFLRRHLPCKGNVQCPRCHRGFRKAERLHEHYQQCRGGGGGGVVAMEQRHQLQHLSPHAGRPVVMSPINHSPRALGDPGESTVRQQQYNRSPVEKEKQDSARIPDPKEKENIASDETKEDTGSEEIKVYILDDDLVLENGAKVPAYNSDDDEDDDEDKDREEESKESNEVGYSSTAEGELKQCQLANRLSATIKFLFEEEELTETRTQMKVMSLAMEKLGLNISFVSKENV